METRNHITVVVEGNPIAKKRPRFFRRGNHVGTYNDQLTDEGRFIVLARGQITHKFDTALHLDMTFCLQRPKSHYGTGRNSDKLKPSAPKKPCGRPDLDNYIKFVLDCLNQIAWHDDCQVVSVSAAKIYSDRPPMTMIVIKEA